MDRIGIQSSDCVCFCKEWNGTFKNITLSLWRFLSPPPGMRHYYVIIAIDVTVISLVSEKPRSYFSMSDSC